MSAPQRRQAAQLTRYREARLWRYAAPDQHDNTVIRRRSACLCMPLMRRAATRHHV